MPHFQARVERYPHYLFVSSRLRALRKKEGEQFPSGTVRFQHGVLDTVAQGFTEEEAEAIYQDLSKSPIWNIFVRPLRWLPHEDDDVPQVSDPDTGTTSLSMSREPTTIVLPEGADGSKRGRR